ncbi:MAG: hypothetical protein HKN12_05210 [Gemmatimonadetes bacterium]|nr:hypothetical protein [Gemmatimonadota bacterium]
MQIRSSLTRAAVAATVLAGVITAPTDADAQLELTSYGPRAGFSADPDQFVIGAFADWGPLAPMLHLVTSGEIGFGNDITVLQFNGDALYRFEGADTPVVFFAGGGLGIARWSIDVPAVPGFTSGGSVSSTEVGLNLVGGLEKDLGGYKTGSVELRIGVGDLPDFKVMVSLGFI